MNWGTGHQGSRYPPVCNRKRRLIVMFTRATILADFRVHATQGFEQVIDWGNKK